MMEKIIINVEKSTRMVSLTKTTIGNDLENLQEELVFKFTDEFVNGSARLEYKVNGNKYHIPMTKEGESYTVPIKNVLTREGKIEMQLVVVEQEQDEEIPVFKSNVFYVYCNKSINAQEEAMDDYEYWLDVIQTKLASIDEALEEVDNLDIDVSKTRTTATVEIIKKDGTTKSVEIEDGTDGIDGQDGTSLQFIWQGTSLGIKTDDMQDYVFVDLQGQRGPVGPQGEAFQIKKTYATVQAMIDDYDNMEINDYVMISGNIEQEDNAKLFTKTETEDPTYRWQYLADFSGASGIRGPQGVSVTNANINANGELVLTVE